MDAFRQDSNDEICQKKLQLRYDDKRAFALD